MSSSPVSTPKVPTTPTPPSYMRSTRSFERMSGKVEEVHSATQERMARIRTRSKSFSSLNRERVRVSAPTTPQSAKVKRVVSRLTSPHPNRATPKTKVTPRQSETPCSEEEKRPDEESKVASTNPSQSRWDRLSKGLSAQPSTPSSLEGKRPASIDTRRRKGSVQRRGKDSTPGVKATRKAAPKEKKETSGLKGRKRPGNIHVRREKVSVPGRARERVEAAHIKSRSLETGKKSLEVGRKKKSRGTRRGVPRTPGASHKEDFSSQTPGTATTPASGKLRSALKRHVNRYGVITAPITPGVVESRRQVSFQALEQTPKKAEEEEKENTPFNLKAEQEIAEPLQQKHEPESRPSIEEEVQQLESQAETEPLSSQPIEVKPEEQSESSTAPLQESHSQQQPEELSVEPSPQKLPELTPEALEREKRFSETLANITAGIAKLSAKPQPATAAEPKQEPLEKGISEEPLLVNRVDLNRMFKGFYQRGPQPAIEDDEISSISGEESLPEIEPLAPDPDKVESKPSSLDERNFSVVNHLLRIISIPRKGELTPSEINTNLLNRKKNSQVDKAIFHEKLLTPCTQIAGELKDLDHLDAEVMKEFTAFTFPCFTVSDSELQSLALKCPFLKEVTLFMCHDLTSSGLQAFHSKKLSCFRLFDCPQVDDDSLVELIEKCSDSLEEVAIIGRPISHSLIVALSKCKKLRELDLSYCSFPTDMEKEDWRSLHNGFKALKTMNITRAKNLSEGSENWRGLDTLRIAKNLILKGIRTLDEVHNAFHSAVTHAVSLIAPISILDFSEKESKEKYLEEVREEVKLIRKELSRGEAKYVFREKFGDKEYVKSIYEKAKRMHEEKERIRKEKAEKRGQQYTIREFGEKEINLDDCDQFFRNLLRTCNIEPEETGLFHPNYHPRPEEMEVLVREVEAWIQAATDLCKLIGQLSKQFCFSERGVVNFLAMRNKEVQQRIDLLNLAGLGLLRTPRMLRIDEVEQVHEKKAKETKDTFFSGLTRIDLQNNQLTSFPVEMIQRLRKVPREELLVIDLRNNPQMRQLPSEDLGVPIVNQNYKEEVESIKEKLKSTPRKSPRRWGFGRKNETPIRNIAVLV